MHSSLKNLIRPAYYWLGLDRTLHWYLRRLGINTERSVQMGPVSLSLDRAIRHENAYYLAHRRGDKDMDELLIRYLLRPGDTALDAGANIGFTAALFLTYGAGAVHCFEPVSAVFRKLSRLQHPNLHLHPLALSDHEGTETIYVSDRHNQGSSLKRQFLSLFPYVFGKSELTEKIRVSTLDKHLPDTTFDYMKIDIEGSEVDFLKGARAHLEQRRPRIVHIESYALCFDEAHAILGPLYRHYARVSTSRTQGIAILGVDERPEGFDPTDNFIYFNEPSACALGFIRP